MLAGACTPRPKAGRPSDPSAGRGHPENTEQVPVTPACLRWPSAGEGSASLTPPLGVLGKTQREAGAQP